MKMRAQVVPGRVLPERIQVEASDPPRPKKVESARAARVSLSRKPKTPARKSAKRIEVRPRKMTTHASGAEMFRDSRRPPPGGFWITGMVVSGTDAVAGTVAAGVDAGAAAGLACAGIVEGDTVVGSETGTGVWTAAGRDGTDAEDDPVLAV
jgi:hypothetical protein